MVRILIQLCVVGLISILSTTIVSPPRTFGDFSIFLPLSYPLLLYWNIDGLLPVWPPHQYYSISVFRFHFEGGPLRSEYGSFTVLRAEIFLHSMPFFLIMNTVLVGALLILSELWKYFNIKNINGKR
jgi:hypothetical protein